MTRYQPALLALAATLPLMGPTTAARAADDAVDGGNVWFKRAQRGFIGDHDICILGNEGVGNLGSAERALQFIRRRPHAALFAREIERVALLS